MRNATTSGRVEWGYARSTRAVVGRPVVGRPVGSIVVVLRIDHAGFDKDYRKNTSRQRDNRTSRRLRANKRVFDG
jgi:hypothetical protein